MRTRHTLAAAAAVIALPLVVACGAVDTTASTATPSSSSSSESTASSDGTSSSNGATSSGDAQSGTDATSAEMSSAEARLVALVNEAYGEAQLGLHRGHQPVENVLDAVLQISHDELHVRMEQQGQNLAAVAEDLGIDLQTLVDALVADWATAIQSALDSGAIDEAKAAAYTAALEEAFTFRVTWDGSAATPTFAGIDV